MQARPPRGQGCLEVCEPARVLWMGDEASIPESCLFGDHLGGQAHMRGLGGGRGMSRRRFTLQHERRTARSPYGSHKTDRLLFTTSLNHHLVQAVYFYHEGIIPHVPKGIPNVCLQLKIGPTRQGSERTDTNGVEHLL